MVMSFLLEAVSKVTNNPIVKDRALSLNFVHYRGITLPLCTPLPVLFVLLHSPSIHRKPFARLFSLRRVPVRSMRAPNVPHSVPRPLVLQELPSNHRHIPPSHSRRLPSMGLWRHLMSYLLQRAPGAVVHPHHSPISSTVHSRSSFLSSQSTVTSHFLSFPHLRLYASPASFSPLWVHELPRISPQQSVS